MLTIIYDCRYFSRCIVLGAKYIGPFIHSFIQNHCLLSWGPGLLLSVFPIFLIKYGQSFYLIINLCRMALSSAFFLGGCPRPLGAGQNHCLLSRGETPPRPPRARFARSFDFCYMVGFDVKLLPYHQSLLYVVVALSSAFFLGDPLSPDPLVQV